MIGTVTCPECGLHLMLPGSVARQTVQCPRCQHLFAPESEAGSTSPQTDDAENEAIDASVDRIERPPALVGEWKAMAAILAIALGLLALLLSLYVQWERINLILTQLKLEEDAHLPDAPAQVVAHQDRVEEFRGLCRRWEEWDAVAGLLKLWMSWPALVLFLLWFHQAVSTARVVDPTGFPHPPAHALLAFLIPIANLYWPMTLMQDVWRGCQNTPRQLLPYSLLIPIWWFCWIASAVLALVSLRAPTGPLDGGPVGAPLFVVSPLEQLAASKFAALAIVSLIVSGAVLIYLIQAIARGQRRRYVELYEDPA